jgi:hypothetical protein
MKGIKTKIKSQSLSNRFRFFLAYLVPLDVDVVPIKKTFKMAAVAMVTKVQNMLSSLQTADPFES